MKTPDYLKPKSFSLNLTPMIDVVFLLIIFFIVSSNLIQQDISVPVDLPEAETAKVTGEPETRKMTINIPQSGTILVGTQLVDRNQLRELLIQQRQMGGEKMELRIRTNKSVPFGEIAPILVFAADCGIWNVSFAVTEKHSSVRQ
ncbi:MAG: biopolymer transporter ExbD [Planctomycetaceae bacterium]|jgi:biopolymer transport protein ExbD|nr:biopolymer transporter ExbD [Planctomycetaceae bacterium]